jgi:hypothetical protein
VHRISQIESAIEAPRAQWQGVRREHSLSPTRPTSNAANGLVPVGPGRFLGSYRVAQLSRIASDRFLLRSLSAPKIASGRASDMTDTVH